MILCVICSEMCRAVRLSLRPGLRPQAGVAYHEPRLCENCLRADAPFLRNQIQRQLCRALSQCGAVLVYASEGHAQNRRILNVATTDNRTIFGNAEFHIENRLHRPIAMRCLQQKTPSGRGRSLSKGFIASYPATSPDSSPCALDEI